jgi:spore germination cell wall hydrolase CwlJ-like protein
VAAIKALPPPNLLKPVSPEEATKENAERPFVARPDTPASRFVLRADAENRSRAVTCLAQAVYYEAAGEGTDGGRAVAQVVLNRVRHPGFPSTICGVVYEGADRPTGCQFSFTCDGSMQRIPVPWLWTRSKQIAEQALNGRVFARVGHATHYHADYVLPYWADSLDKSVQIGRHIFYRLRSSLGDARAFSQHYGGTEPPFREPGATNVIPATPEGQQAANALISDGAQVAPKPVDPAPHKPDIPLLIDSSTSTLLADGQGPPRQQHRPKQATECGAGADRRQLSPLSATDMRAGDNGPSC